MDYRAAIFEALDEDFDGADDTDYDSRDQILDIAIEVIQERDDICQMCGAGPHMEFIQDWVNLFCSKEQ
jgi:hypothetical protein